MERLRNTTFGMEGNGKFECTGLDMERLRYIMLDMEGLMLYGCKKTRQKRKCFLQVA